MTGSTGTYTLSVIELGANGASEADTDFPQDIEGFSTDGRVEVGGSATGSIGSAQATATGSAWSLRQARPTRSTWRGWHTNRGTLVDTRGMPGIYDSSSTQISGTGDDDGGEGVNSRFLFTPDATSTHYVATGAFGTGTYYAVECVKSRRRMT